MEWSPEDAMTAYLKTVLLNKSKQECSDEERTRLTEPKCMEFISALAAGSRAKLIVEITSQGATPLTAALAVAAKQIGGGRLLCMIPHRKHLEPSRSLISSYDLTNYVQFVVGNPCEMIQRRQEKVDFAVIDCKCDDHLRIFKNIDLNPSGSVVVVNNIAGGDEESVCFGEVVKEKAGGFESVVTLPIGEGMELTRIGYSDSNNTTNNKISRRRYKRFHVIFES